MSDEKPLKFVEACYDSEEYGQLYALNQEIPEEELEKAKPYMKKFTPRSFKNILNVSGDPFGWMCIKEDVPKAEKALGITETLEKFEQEQAKLTKEYNNRSILKNEAMNQLESAFSQGKRPTTNIKKLFKKATKIYDPANGFRDNHEVGAGTLFIISSEEIWYIMNNGGKNDNWNMNNVIIPHAGGAIGFKLAYNEELEYLIKEVSEENEYNGEPF